MARLYQLATILTLAFFTGFLLEANAQKLAEFLSAHPRVKMVNYTWLPEHHGHSLHYSQAKGAGSVDHIDKGADITVSCIPMADSHASDFGLMKIDETGRITQFSEKPKGVDLEAMKVDTTILGLPHHEALNFPYIASIGIYVFKKAVLLKLLRWRYPQSNDFGSEIIPCAVNEHNVRVNRPWILIFNLTYILLFHIRTILIPYEISLTWQAYLFNNYCEDIGTIKSFFDANLALTSEVLKKVQRNNIRKRVILHLCCGQQNFYSLTGMCGPITPEELETALKQLRKAMDFKATPMPSFYNEDTLTKAELKKDVTSIPIDMTQRKGGRRGRKL